jgi:hypothetical protein
MPSSDGPEQDLAQADRHIAEAQARIMRQTENHEPPGPKWTRYHRGPGLLNEMKGCPCRHVRRLIAEPRILERRFIQRRPFGVAKLQYRSPGRRATATGRNLRTQDC